jgi:hypothetical protein
MGWFRVSSNRLVYRGRLSREPFAAWAGTVEGEASIDERARRDRLWLFAHQRTRRRMWRELELLSRGESFAKTVQWEAGQFEKTIVDASHAPGLPRRTIALHRLVLVPRTLVAGRMRTALRRRLFNSDAFPGLDARLRDFFCEQLVVELDAAVAAHRPTASRPLLTHETWGCVGYHTDYEWVDPFFAGQGWGGHLLMFEFPVQGLARQSRKALEQAVQDIQSSLANLSRNQRHAIVQVAVDGLPRAAS